MFATWFFFAKPKGPFCFDNNPFMHYWLLGQRRHFHMSCLFYCLIVCRCHVIVVASVVSSSFVIPHCVSWLLVCIHECVCVCVCVCFKCTWLSLHVCLWLCVIVFVCTYLLYFCYFDCLQVSCYRCCCFCCFFFFCDSTLCALFVCMNVCVCVCVFKCVWSSLCVCLWLCVIIFTCLRSLRW